MCQMFGSKSTMVVFVVKRDISATTQKHHASTPDCRRRGGTNQIGQRSATANIHQIRRIKPISEQVMVVPFISVLKCIVYFYLFLPFLAIFVEIQPTC